MVLTDENVAWKETLAIISVVIALSVFVGWGVSYGMLRADTKTICVRFDTFKADTDSHFALKRAKIENHEDRLKTVEIKLDYIVQGIDELKGMLR